MKINRQLLTNALEIVKPGLTSKETNIEQSTSFCFLNGNVVTYNDEISISCPVKGLELEGAINANELYAFVNKIKTEEVDLEVKENEIILKSGRSKVGLKLQLEILLPIGEIGSVSKWKSLPDDFLKGVAFTIGACSRDMSKPVLTCVHVNQSRLEGCDNYRAASYELKIAVPIKPFLIPANICITLLKFKPVKIAEGVGWVHFKNEKGAVLSCRIFEEKYVNIETLLTFDGNDIIFPKEINSILDRASIFSKREHTLDEAVKINLSNKKLEIRSESESGWFEEKSRVEYTGEPIEFMITPYLLKDILTETTTGKLKENRLMFEGENWKYITLLRG